jgi:glucokinase
MANTKKHEKLFLGVDVGGTKILAALVRASGKILARKRCPTPRQEPPEATLAAVVAGIEQLLAEEGVERRAIRAVGLAVPGIVEPLEGRIIVTPNLNLGGFDMGPLLEKQLGVPVVVGNDVNLGTLGEQWLGAAVLADSAVGMFIGTGIGGGIIIEGKLVVGHRGAAAEIGHMKMQQGGPVCGCGGHGCLEALASRTAIERDIRQAIAAGRKTLLAELSGNDLSVIRSSVLKKALTENDELAKEVIGQAAATIGDACLQIRNLLDPEVIILGGGLVEACKFFIFPIVRKSIASDPFNQVWPGGRVVAAALGDDAVVLGAVALAQQHLGFDPFEKAKKTLRRFPPITEVSPQNITVGGRSFAEDVYIRVNGKVGRREKARKHSQTPPQQFDPAELKFVSQGNPSILIIGTGHDGAAVLTAEGEDFLLKRGITYETSPTPEAVSTYNAIKGRKAALIHL